MLTHNFLTDNMNIPSVEDFDLYKEKSSQLNESIENDQGDRLLELIDFHLSSGSFEINKDIIEFRIQGLYPENIVKRVNKLFQAKGWKKLKVERDQDARPLYFSNVKLIRL